MKKSTPPKMPSQVFSQNFLQFISKPICKELNIPVPTFHTKGFVPFFAETRMINGDLHVYISRIMHQNMKELLDTIAHELIHCWQFWIGVYQEEFADQYENQAIELAPFLMTMMVDAVA